MDKSLQSNEKIIIIGDKDYFPLLEANMGFANIKFMPTAKAISTLTFEITEKLILALMKGNKTFDGVEYTKAKQILQAIQLLGSKRLENAPKLIKDAAEIVEKNIQPANFDASYIFKNKTLYLLNQDGLDIQTKQLFKEYGYELKDINFEQYGDIPSQWRDHYDVINFDNKFEQYMYVFAKIRKILIDKPEMVDHIRIVVKDEYDLYYLSFFSKIFNIDVYVNFPTTLYSQPSVIKAMKKFYTEEKIDTAYIESTDEPALMLKKIIETYELDKTSSFKFEKAYLNLLEIVNETKVKDETIENKGIRVSNELSFEDLDKDDQTFVLDFQDEIFYETFKDNDVIIDTDKNDLMLNQSYIKTLIDKRKKWNFLHFNNIVHLSRVKQHLNNHIYDSGFVKKGDEIFEKRNFSIFDKEDFDELNTFSFTKEAAKLLASTFADKNKKISNVNFEQYDNQVKDLKIPFDQNKEYSISVIENYSKCPFKYLLDYKCNMSSLDDKYYACLGNLFHKVLEYVDVSDFKEKYDETYYPEGLKVFEKKMTEDGKKEMPLKYKIFTEGMIKEWFKHVAFVYHDRLLELKEGMNNKNISLFKEFTFHDVIENTNYKFKGTIDCIMTHEEQGNKYLSIIDYKSGDKAFQPLATCVGLNVQLPMYFDAICRIHTGKSAYPYDKDEEKKEKEIIPKIKPYTPMGFGIKTIFGNSYKKLAGKDPSLLTPDTISLKSTAKIYGKSDKKYRTCLTIKELNAENKPINSDNQLCEVENGAKDFSLKTTLNKRNDTPYSIDEIVEQAKKVVVEMLDSMKSSHYPITITSSEKDVKQKINEVKKDKTNCKYCEFADICYRTKQNIVNLRQTVYKNWSTKGEK